MDAKRSMPEIWADASEEDKKFIRGQLSARIGEARARGFAKLVDKLAADFKIEDRFLLERAVDAAMLVYFGPGAMDNEDRKELQHLARRMDELLGRNDNLRRLADRMIDRHRNIIDGEPWDAKKAIDIHRLLRPLIDDGSGLMLLADIERACDAPPEKADFNLHSTVSLLLRYWASIGKKQRSRTKFVGAVLHFIDPDAVEGLPNVIKGRLR